MVIIISVLSISNFLQTFAVPGHSLSHPYTALLFANLGIAAMKRIILQPWISPKFLVTQWICLWMTNHFKMLILFYQASSGAGGSMIISKLDRCFLF